jgi:hypothetical protein
MTKKFDANKNMKKWLNAEQLLMRDTVNIINTSKTYILDMSKINTLEDVKKVLEGMDYRITLMEGTTSESYEKLKDYLK